MSLERREESGGVLYYHILKGGLGSEIPLHVWMLVARECWTVRYRFPFLILFMRLRFLHACRYTVHLLHRYILYYITNLHLISFCSSLRAIIWHYMFLKIPVYIIIS